MVVVSFVASPGQFVMVDLRADQKLGRLLQELAIGLALQAVGTCRGCTPGDGSP